MNLLFIFIYLFLAALGLRCCARAFSSCGKLGLLFVVVCGLLIGVASLVAEHGLQARGLQQLWHVASAVVAHRLQSAGSAVVVHGLSCSAACGNLPRPGLEPVSLALAGRFLTTVPPGKSQRQQLTPNCKKKSFYKSKRKKKKHSQRKMAKDVNRQKNTEKEFKIVPKFMETLVMIQNHQLKTTTRYHSFSLIRLTESLSSNLIVLPFGREKALLYIVIKQYNFYPQQSGSSYQNFKCTYPFTQQFLFQEFILHIWLNMFEMTSVQVTEFHFISNSRRLQNSKYPPKRVE